MSMMKLSAGALLLAASAEAFSPSPLTSLKAPAPSSSLQSKCPAGVQAGLRSSGLVLRAERDDGASEQDIKDAYATYDRLMSNMNDGKGYWMDSPYQFFDNIKTAFDRNLGDKAGTKGVELGADGELDLTSSFFKPLTDDDDDDEEKAPAVPAPVATPVAKKVEKDADLEELQAKMAAVEEAKKKAEKEAAKLKSQLEKEK